MKRWLIAAALGTALAWSVPGSAQDAKPAMPFNGKDLTGWKLKGKAEKSQWKVGSATMDEKNPGQLVYSPEGTQLVNAGKGGIDVYSEAKFGDCRIEVEVMVPKGSNSGIYVMGEYEVQILDSWGRAKVGPGDIGGLYGAAAPRTNAAKKPGEWQSFVIDFQAPRFGADGKKTSNAKFLKMVLNGETIHENVEMKGPTPSGVTGKEAATGPIMFQGDHGPVVYRNLRITAK